MHIVHLISDLSTSAGGMAQCVASLCSALSANTRTSISLVAGNFDLRDESIDLQLVRQVPVNPQSLVSVWSGLRAIHRQSPIDIIHDHGQWLPINLASMLFSAKSRVPRIVSCHGMLNTRALAHRSLKKRVAWHAYGRQCLNQAAFVHVTSEQEREQVASYREANLVMIPNGFNPSHLYDPSIVTERRKVFAFLGRIHPIKGVSELMEAWQRIERNGWELWLAGPDEIGLMASMNLPVGVRYLGELDYQEKYKLLSTASVLVLPSRSENFGIVVPEALSVNTPVIATRGTPWKDLETEGIGWWIDLSVESLAKTLQQVINCPSDILQKMGTKGRHYALKHYGWNALGERFARLYEQTLARTDTSKS